MSGCRRFQALISGTKVIVAGLLVAISWNAWAGAEGKPDGKSQHEGESDQKPRGESDGRERKVIKSDAAWRKILTREQFRVARRKGTEPPYKGAYWNAKKDGIYQCVCCGQSLFDSAAKFDSKTGWPSFWEPIDKRALLYREDRSERTVRMEVQCSRCDAHLGHVFGDGPAPTGERYCINSVALKRVDRKPPSANESKPEE